MLPCTEKGGEKGISWSRGQVSVLGRSLATRESRQRGMAPGNGVGSMAATVREKGRREAARRAHCQRFQQFGKNLFFPFSSVAFRDL